MSDLINVKKINKLSPNDKAERFLKLSELRKRVNEEYDLIRSQLLEETQKLGIKQLKTDNYTISRAKRVNVYVVNDEEAGKALEDLGYQIKYQKKISDLSMPTVKAVAKDREIKGVETTESEYVVVRINKE
jgi:hypothetical protein